MIIKLNNILEDVIKVINNIKVYILNSGRFQKLCEEVDAEHWRSFLVHRSEMSFLRGIGCIFESHTRDFFKKSSYTEWIAKFVY